VKGLVTTTALAYALMGTAHAGTPTMSMPSAMHGMWCHPQEVDKKTTRYTHGRCEDHDGHLKIDATGWRGWEHTCTIRNAEVTGRSIETWTLCGGEGVEWNGRDTFWLRGAHLFLREGWHGNETHEGMSLECAGFRVQPPEPEDRDPIVRARIDFSREGTHAVTHTSLSGKAYVRHEQYRDYRTWRDPNGIHWSGTSVRNPRNTMVGRLVGDQDRYRYTERAFRDGKLETIVVSTCVWKAVDDAQQKPAFDPAFNVSRPPYPPAPESPKEEPPPKSEEQRLADLADAGKALGELLALLEQMRVIDNDLGGKVTDYIERYQKDRIVVIRGPCISACTLVMSFIPKERICFDKDGALGFHKARFAGTETIAVETTKWMLESHPKPIQQWIAKKGGYAKLPGAPWNVYWTLKAPELWKMGYLNCEGPSVERR
jgi:hypothetical protein